MNISRHIMLSAACVLISSCGMKSITPEEAALIYKEIYEKLSDPEYKLPNTLKTEGYYCAKYENGYEFNIKSLAYHDADKEVFHVNEHITKTTNKETIEEYFEAWSWKDGEKYYYATSTKSDGEQELFWSYTNTLRTNNLGLENYQDMSLDIAKEQSELDSRNLNTKFGENIKWSFQSSGGGSLSHEINGKIKETAYNEKICFRDYLLKEYFCMSGNITEHYTFSNRKSAFKKPELEHYKHVDIIEA